MAKQTFTTGQVLTAAQMTSLQQTAMGGGSTTAKTTSYVLTAADAGTVVQMNAAGATTITVNTALFSAGDAVEIQNIGAGVCTITAGTATVSTAGSLALTQYEGGKLYFNSASAAVFFDYVQSSGASGLTLVSATTFSAVSSHSVDSIFTSTYKYYRAVLKFTASGLNTMTVRFRASGTSNSSANYYSVNRSTDSAGTNEYVGSIAATSISLLGKYNTDFNGVSFDILDPQAALDKIITGTAFSRGSQTGGLATVNFGGAFNSSSAMDGLELIASSGTISGTLKIYGYQN